MTEPPTSERDDASGLASLVEGFEDFEQIGSGSFSTVYRATQVRLGRPVAVKVLDATLSSPSDRAAFTRECRAMGLLSRHPHIVTVYSDARTHDGRPCLVMELYERNYRDILTEQGPLPIDELLLVGVRVAGALQVAHDSGVLHRDIKPHNIFLSDFGEPALGDFGISSLDDERNASGDAGLSVAYAAPEIIEDSDASFLSDVYSLAATLHHLAAGTAPFAGPEIEGVIRRIVSEEPPEVDRVDLPASLRALLRRGLAKEPEHRPDSAGDFAESLRDIRQEIGLDAVTIPLRSEDRVVDTARSASSSVATPSQPAPPADENTLFEFDRHDAPESDEPSAGRADPNPPPADSAGRETPADPGPDVSFGARSTSGPPDHETGRGRWWTTDHVAVDIVIAAVVVALVAYAAIGLL